MKRFYLLASVLLAATTLTAQTTIDFEDLQLDANSFYNGDDGAGGFESGGAWFTNAYDDEFFVWNGFSYSNTTDVTAPDFTNQYSSITGSGANGSENYAVYYEGFTPDTIYFPSVSDLSSVELTNTTYTYHTIKDGDAFTDKFEENDFFFITIFGWDEDDVLVDSVNFFLADYAGFTEGAPYIIDEWTEVDLSTLEGVSYLTFDFKSSDVGEWGINTPTYFAMDNLSYSTGTTGIAKNELANFKIYPNPATDIVNISGDNGSYTVYNISGKAVMAFENNNSTTSINVSSLEAGVYFIRNSKSANTEKLVIQ